MLSTEQQRKNVSASGVWRANNQNNEHDGDTEHEDYVS